MPLQALGQVRANVVKVDLLLNNFFILAAFARLNIGKRLAIGYVIAL